MVRSTMLLCRVPVIKFRKGGGGHSAPPPPSSPAKSAAPSAGSCAMSRPGAPQAQPSAPMSTGRTIPDIDLPARYRRQPLSEEEIAHINGGGIKDPPVSSKPQMPKALGVIKIPKGILLRSGSKKKEVVTMNIVLHKTGGN